MRQLAVFPRRGRPHISSTFERFSVLFQSSVLLLANTGLDVIPSQVGTSVVRESERKCLVLMAGDVLGVVDCKGYTVAWSAYNGLTIQSHNPINPHIVSSLDLTKPRVNGLYQSQPFFRAIMQPRVSRRKVSIALWSLTSSCLA